MSDNPKSEFTIKHAPPTRQSEKTFNYLMYSQKLGEITDSPWQRCCGGSLADARKKVGDDLVEDPGMPEMIFTPAEIRAAELRAAHMADKIEDLIVTLVCEVTYATGKSLRVESVPYSQLHGRIEELHTTVIDGKVRVWIAYSEETHQVFVLNGIEIDEKPRMPGYGKYPVGKRTAYRNTSSGVIR